MPPRAILQPDTGILHRTPSARAPRILPLPRTCNAPRGIRSKVIDFASLLALDLAKGATTRTVQR
ncbi:uncharacterized protein THITE_2122656 [Thermothielavioides terrestris NRRL 8126]|uniref:Uncharacterized protein n=1 Tax=Thermothielavioides terrestris (strain ATCC 38088 / NRRL 8126) TaxID=578455 RepID=G2RDW3_THETT|nr:uncharacterized protein THITE_2122656 [Thermothielavioides terrestris NRRL 8126]AEO70846.1 hypothetical protein THITE_2122656 [Thermothielavioides terrestris NRRL 8126]